MKKTINIKFLNKNFNYKLPSYETDGSAGLDLRACIKNHIILKSREVKLISTGIAININDYNIAAIILPRSGLSHRYGITLSNNVGLIDSDYQGPILVSLLNRSKYDFIIKPNYRIAQILFIPIFKVKLQVVKHFIKKSKRHNRGFGHSGIK
ncbi:MAG: dUTP diphosphatase [Candidatus Lightella neohaematopini]|nr:dUTP diphosphatase [Candidatus Lightella neohaematopini]MCV2528870.1 dUTP diphosphatase [Candidatus Lightella neohaematopini]